MSKIIKMTPEMIEESKRRFEQKLKTMNCVDGKVTFTDVFTPTGQKAIIWFTPDAYTKMIALIQDSDKEVAWHGVAHRVDDHVGEYVISDILVYPQEVTGSTVNTDQAEYETWLMQQDDDVFNNLRMQGHSHVRMETFASATDLEHQAKIVQQLEGDMFYIFMIWNKYFKFTAKIYDLKINTLYEPGDISVQMIGASKGLIDFITEARAMVKVKTYSNYGGYQGGYQNGYQSGYQNQNKPATSGATNGATTPSKTSQPAENSGGVNNNSKQENQEKDSAIPSRPKSCIGNGWSGASNHKNSYDDEDYDNPHYGCYH